LKLNLSDHEIEKRIRKRLAERLKARQVEMLLNDKDIEDAVSGFEYRGEDAFNWQASLHILATKEAERAMEDVISEMKSENL
jgi:hypothetical protein